MTPNKVDKATRIRPKVTRKNLLILAIPIVIVTFIVLNFFGYVGTKRNQLFNAAYAGNWKRFAALISDWNEYDITDRYGQTLLGLAATQPDEQIISLMISQGADVNLRQRTRTGGTALNAAVWARHAKVAEVLLNNGANVNAKEKAGWTPLHIAANRPSEVLVKLLLKHGAEVNVKNRGHRTPLHEALRSPDGAKLEVAQLLIGHGADVNANSTLGKNWDIGHDSHPFGTRTTPKGETPLEIAVNGGYVEIVDLLKEHGANE